MFSNEKYRSIFIRIVWKIIFQYANECTWIRRMKSRAGRCHSWRLDGIANSMNASIEKKIVFDSFHQINFAFFFSSFWLALVDLFPLWPQYWWPLAISFVYTQCIFQTHSLGCQMQLYGFALTTTMCSVRRTGSLKMNFKIVIKIIKIITVITTITFSECRFVCRGKAISWSQIKVKITIACVCVLWFLSRLFLCVKTINRSEGRVRLRARGE